MAHPSDTMLDRVLDAGPGWLFTLAGLALVAMALLTPAWLSLHQVRWQRDVMQLQAKQLDRQHQRYVEFDHALAANNAIVLERLAFTQLHEQPADKQLLVRTDRVPTMTSTATARWTATGHDGISLANGKPGGMDSLAGEEDGAGQSASVAAWLHEPVAKIGVDLPAYRAPNTRLIRLCTGQSRWLVIAAGGCCLVGGVWWRAGRVESGEDKA